MATSDELLLTILQISDLHIGEIDPTSGDARLTNAGARLLAQFSWFDGVLGHHGRGLEDLDDFYGSLVEERGKPLLIVSGDLTRIGGGNEFDTVDDFLVSQVDLNPPHQRWVGLHDGSWRDHAIPGNHDYWSGLPVIWGGPHAAFQAYFPPGRLPYVRDLHLSNGRVVKFVGIDTDADVSPWGQKRLRAVGSFQSQLTAAGAQLGLPSDDEIRVLVMHHSWDKRGLLLSIDSGSRASLEQFLVSHRIQIALTGHTHQPLLKPFTAYQGNHAQNVLECRCGTTTQNDQVPYAWRTFLGRLPKRSWPPNTLLVHSLYESGRSGRWSVETFVRTKQRGFVTLGPTGQHDIVV